MRIKLSVSSPKLCNSPDLRFPTLLQAGDIHQVLQALKIRNKYNRPLIIYLRQVLTMSHKYISNGYETWS